MRRILSGMPFPGERPRTFYWALQHKETGHLSTDSGPLMVPELYQDKKQANVNDRRYRWVKVAIIGA